MDLFRRYRRNATRVNAEALFRRVVKQARNPVFYEDLGVPDTIDGRFDLVIVHAFVVLRRLKVDVPRTEPLSQSVFDALFSSLDDSLRQMGVGDLSVGKRIKKMSEAFYGRVNAYDAPLVAGDREGLSEALRRNLFRGEDVEPGLAEALADYLIATYEALLEQPTERFLLGLVSFPVKPAPPARVAEVAHSERSATIEGARKAGVGA